MSDFGAWALLPPVLAIVFAIATRRVYQALVLGILVAGLMVAWNDGARLGVVTGGFMQAVGWIVAGVADSGHAGVIAFTLFLGALVAVMQRSGAIEGFGRAAMAYASTRRRGQTVAWWFGALFLAIDDYFHVIAAGTIFRPVTDNVRISREKLAYIIDSTAAPMVIMVPISTWVGFILGVVSPVYQDNQVSVTPFASFLAGIPYNFYAILTVAFVGIIAITGRDFGPMRRAEQRAQETGEVLRPGSKPLVAKELDEMAPSPNAVPRALNLVLPVAFLFLAAISMLYLTGYASNDPARDSFAEALQNSSAELSLAIASFLALLFAMSLYLIQGSLKQDEFLDTCIDGFKAMVPALAILGLAWGIGNAVGSDGVDLAGFLSDALGDTVSPAAVPLIAFLLSGGIAFATGTSFGTFAIMLPATLGLVATNPENAQWLGPVLAATVGGAVFGDHCSPISDTTVMSSMAGHCDHIDHVRTQLPYALTMAGVAAAGYGMLAFTENLAAAWIVNVGVLVAAALILLWRRE